ncbi:hypothetical protein [Paenibacillus sp.]|nr:hypothetical protein [Paenibacillus sp.]
MKQELREVNGPIDIKRNILNHLDYRPQVSSAQVMEQDCAFLTNYKQDL